MADDRRRERLQDQAVEDSFPASDPPAQSGVIGPRGVGELHSGRRPEEPRNAEAKPKGTPTSDRHATETAYGREGGSERGHRR